MVSDNAQIDVDLPANHQPTPGAMLCLVVSGFGTKPKSGPGLRMVVTNSGLSNKIR